MRRNRWLWVTFSIALVLLLGTLATTYNLAVVQDYRRLISLRSPDWLPILGIIGFAAVLAGLLIFLFGLLHEMKLNQLQSEFIAHVSHELKTPIATLELTSGLLRSEESIDHPGNERRDLWNSHQEELQRLKTQVEELLEAARWQAKPPRLERMSIHLGKWISDSSQRWREILGPEATLELTGDALDFEITADAKRMALIFGNLIENSKKFARGAPSVRITTQQSNDQWRIEVRDTGWGFPEKFAKRIFQRFYRAPHGAPHAIPGTGLGLHLCRSAARSMDWKISAASGGEGTGACFTLTGRIPKK